MKKIIVGILQPGYLPWLGFFEQLNKSDIFVIYDDVQYDKNGWRNRNKIKTAQGAHWLTVPVSIKLSLRPTVAEVKINNHVNWRKDHLLSIKHAYAKAAFYKEYISIFEDAYSKEWGNLVDIDMYFILKLSQVLGLGNKKIIRSSTIGARGAKIEKIIRICQALGAETFYEGASGRDYIDTGYFAQKGIKVEFQDYKHPVYRQLHGDFIPYLSVVDLLFNEGPGSLPILLNKNSERGAQ